jgi:hypothetical protein
MDMSVETSYRLQWLRRVLLAKVIVTLLAWGLPSLIGPMELLSVFGLATPPDPMFIRLFGALATASAVAYWYAYRNPVRNAAIVKFGVFDNGLVTLTIIVLGLTTGISSWFVWVSGALTALFCVALAMLMPRE